MEEYLKVGSITSTHGIKGEVKVFPTTDDVNRFKKLKNVHLKMKDGYKPLEICGVKFFKNMVIVKFKGIDNINDVECYKGCDLYVDRDNAVKLNKNEYFIADIIDSKVIFDNENLEGTLKDVLTTAANDVYEIELNDNRTVLVPAIKECILEIDAPNKIIKAHLLDGLLD